MDKIICIFGDSIAWGACDNESGGWVARLRHHFESKDNDISIYNNGVSGDNTDDLLTRFEVECEARAPQIIIFAIGINDSQYVSSKNNNRVSIEEFENNLVELANKAKKISDTTIFIGLTKVDETKTKPVTWNAEKYYDNDNIIKYDSIIKKVSLENSSLFLSLLNLLSKTDFQDGLHPNTEGHKKIFISVKDFLIENRVI